MTTAAVGHPGQDYPGLDHVVILVKDQLDASMALWGRMGFHITPRGHHSMGTSNNLAIFRDNYLELLGYIPENAEKVAGKWQGPIALNGLVWRLPEVEALTDGLAEAGVPAEEPMRFVRPVETADGVFDAAFTIVRLVPDGFAGGISFFCHHETPELVWRKEWQDHPNAVVNVSEFVFAGGEPQEALRSFAKVFGAQQVQSIPGGVAMQAAEARISAITSAAALERYGDLLPDFAHTAPHMVGLGFEVSDLALTRAALTAGNIPFRDDGDRLLVGAQTASGTVLTFHE